MAERQWTTITPGGTPLATDDVVGLRGASNTRLKISDVSDFVKGGILPATPSSVLVTDGAGETIADSLITFDSTSKNLDVYTISTNQLNATAGPSQLFEYQNELNIDRNLLQSDVGAIISTGLANYTLTLPAAGDTALNSSISFYAFQKTPTAVISIKAPQGVSINDIDAALVVTTGLNSLIKFTRNSKNLNQWFSSEIGYSATLQKAYNGGASIDLAFNPVSVNSFEQSLTTGGATISSGGTGYTAGDILEIDGGTGVSAKLRVSIVSSGVITQALILNRGEYTVLPALTGATVTGGTGTGATFDLTLGASNIQQTAANFSTTGGAVIGAGSGYSLEYYESLLVSNKQNGFGGGFVRCTGTDSQALDIIKQDPFLPNGLFGPVNLNTGRMVISDQGDFQEIAYLSDISALAASTAQTGFINNSTETVVSGAGAFYKAEGVYISSSMNDFTHNSGILTYVGVSTRMFRVSVTASIALNLASSTVRVGVASPGVVIASIQSIDFDGSSPSFKSVSCHALISLSTNDTVSFSVSNELTTDNITVRDVSLLATSV